jgi:hypothetical protein
MIFIVAGLFFKMIFFSISSTEYQVARDLETSCIRGFRYLSETKATFARKLSCEDVKGIINRKNTSFFSKFSKKYQSAEVEKDDCGDYILNISFGYFKKIHYYSKTKIQKKIDVESRTNYEYYKQRYPDGFYNPLKYPKTNC